MIPRASLADRINDALPQTQCTRCGFPDCRHYAEAVAEKQAPINQCPPGGQEGVARLAAITGTPLIPLIPLNPVHGLEGPLRIARIEEAACIGCTLCLDVCPVDCIVGGPKALHTVIEHQCTGCGLCLPVCPVDCIVMRDMSENLTGWAAWSESQAAQARVRYAFHQHRLRTEVNERNAALAAAPASVSAATDIQRGAGGPHKDGKRMTIDAALARARARRPA